MKPIARALAGSLVITVLVAGPTLAQDYPPGAPTIEVSDSVVIPCQTITVSGQNLEPGITVEITFGGEVIGTAVVGADGTYSTTVQIPCDTSPGTFVLAAGGATTEITVVAAGGGVGGVTGGNVMGAIGLMAALFVLGIVAIVVTRRRRTATPA